MALEEGQAGTQTGTPEPVRQQIKHRTDAEQQLARQAAIDEARTAGLLGSETLVGQIANVASDSDLANGFEERDAYGGLVGSDGPGNAYGFGMGRQNFGPGGGGYGTVGTGRYGMICGGNGRRCGGGTDAFGIPGGPPGVVRRHQPVVPTVGMGEPVPVGDLDKSIIRRYIKRNLDKIAYCYEHELLAKPDLAGTVQAQFFIQPDGTVKSTQASGVDPAVSSCVAGVISSISFPRPGGGAGVAVTYPFTFHAAGH
jgi:hypothetical protein